MKILIVEDDPSSRLMLQATLRSLGHEVVSAANGLEALKLLAENQIRVIVSDWEMPEIDGLELCQVIRRRPSNEYTYFIMLTAVHITQEEYHSAMKIGVDDFLAKPINPGWLEIRLIVAERILKFANQVRQLESLLPICAYCKKIRDDQDQRQRLEAYLHEHTGTQFSHGICPECFIKVQAEMERMKNNE